MPFFWVSSENYQITPPTQGGAEDSVRLLLTVNPATSFSCSSSQVRGLSFERFSRSWQTVSPISGTFNQCCQLLEVKMDCAVAASLSDITLLRLSTL